MKAKVADLEEYIKKLESHSNAQHIVINILNEELKSERDQIAAFLEDETHEIKVEIMDAITLSPISNCVVLTSASGSCGHLFSLSSVSADASYGDLRCPMCRRDFTNIVRLPSVDKLIQALNSPQSTQNVSFIRYCIDNVKEHLMQLL